MQLAELRESAAGPTDWRETARHARMIMDKYGTITRILKKRRLFTPEISRQTCQICIMLHKIERTARQRSLEQALTLGPMVSKIEEFTDSLLIQIHALPAAAELPATTVLTPS